jgi:hypothetical protein
MAMAMITLEVFMLETILETGKRHCPQAWR